MINKKVVIHHTAIKQDGKNQYDRVNNLHKSKGFIQSNLTGSYVGYHFLVEQDGTVKKNKGLDEVGCHNNAYDSEAKTGYNYSSIGISLAGNFEIDTPNKKQLDAVKTILSTIKQSIGVVKYDETNLFYHKDTKATLCPGKYMPYKSYFYDKETINTSLLSEAWHKVSDFRGIYDTKITIDQVKQLENIQILLGEVASSIRNL